jgi:hypothetical protein
MLIASAALVAATAAGVAPSAAQSKGPKPWCVANGSYGAGSMDCTYWTLQQCRATASGAGGTCRENPEILWAQRRGQVRRGQPRYDNWRY